MEDKGMLISGLSFFDTVSNCNLRPESDPARLNLLTDRWCCSSFFVLFRILTRVHVWRAT